MERRCRHRRGLGRARARGAQTVSSELAEPSSLTLACNLLPRAGNNLRFTGHDAMSKLYKNVKVRIRHRATGGECETIASVQGPEEAGADLLLSRDTMRQLGLTTGARLRVPAAAAVGARSSGANKPVRPSKRPRTLSLWLRDEPSYFSGGGAGLARGRA